MKYYILLFISVTLLSGCSENNPSNEVFKAEAANIYDRTCVNGDCANGLGTMTGSDGSTYIGQFKNNRFEGKGTYTFSDGRKYVGHFKNNKCEGNGVYSFPDGKKYTGLFKNDTCNSASAGTFTFPMGTKPAGKLEHDKCKDLSTMLGVNNN